MYKSVIEIKKDVPEEQLQELKAMANAAFNNRAGMILNSSEDPYTLVYKGDTEMAYGAIHLGQLNLWKKKDVIKHIDSWEYIEDGEFGERCDVIKELSIPIRWA